MTDQTRRRRRGVRASRSKLSQAMSAAGVRTQAALAERIADLEGLESVPRDAVNRAFRQHPIDPNTLARVANALGVEPFTLYLTEHEANADAQASVADSIASPQLSLTPADATRGGWALWLLAVGALALAALLAWQPHRELAEPAPALTTAPSVVPLSPVAGRLTLAVVGTDEASDGALASALRERLSAAFAVASQGATLLTRDLAPAQIAERLQADVVVQVGAETVGRRIGLTVSLFARGTHRQVWAQSMDGSLLVARLPAVSEQAAQAVRYALGLPTALGVSPPHFPLAPVQRDYLRGRANLDAVQSELNIKRAQSRFQAALRQDANYAQAHAGLCEALVQESWMSDEQRTLADAEAACQQALLLARTDPYVMAAQGAMLVRSGRLDDALAIYAQALAQWPKHVDALNGMAAARFARFRQSSNQADLLSARDHARRAAEADPTLWKTHFYLGLYEHTLGDLPQAIAASEVALAQDRNQYVLANLGTMYFCGGDIDKARTYYEEAAALAPQSYVGSEFLGMVYYYLEQFETSVRLRKSAIESLSAQDTPMVQEMWGALGDSYRRAGQRQEAVAAYLQAVEILERDALRGIGSVTDQAARVYYHSVLAQLAPAKVPPALALEAARQLDDIFERAAEPAAFIRLSETWRLQGNLPNARKALARAEAHCPGYALHPDLKDLHAP